MNKLDKFYQASIFSNYPDLMIEAVKGNIEREKSINEMKKVNNEKLAKQLAKEDKLFYGMSVFDGKFYIGTEEQLKKIGCVDITKG